MITKKELREIKEQLRELSVKIEALQEHENYGSLTINWNPGKDKRLDDIETPGITVGMFLPRLQWFNKRLDKWIDKAPAGKRGKTKVKKDD